MTETPTFTNIKWLKVQNLDLKVIVVIKNKDLYSQT